MPRHRPESDRPVLIALHALGASSAEYEAIGERLDSAFDVVALDLPGFGDLSTASGTTVQDMVASVERRIRKHAPVRWMLIGHSMGGKIATIVASRTMSGANGLFGLAGVVLLAASPPVPEPMSEDRRAEMTAWAIPGPIDADAARTFVDDNVGAPLGHRANATAVADVRRSSPEAWRAWLDRGSREDWSETVGQLHVPALIVAGGADGDLGPGAQRRLNGAVYPRATFVTLEGAGHLLPHERPAEVADAITAFWTDDAGAAPALPGDFAHVLGSPRTSARTRSILAARAVADDPAYVPVVLTGAQLATLRILADLVVPQDGTPIDLAARVDTQLARGAGDGWRNADLPPDPDAYRIGLDALAFLGSATQEERRAAVEAIMQGALPRGGTPDGPTPPAAPSFTPEQLSTWFEDVRVDLVRQWLAHPATMSRIGYDGVANGGDERLQGFTLLGADEREGWEPRMEAAR